MTHRGKGMEWIQGIKVETLRMWGFLHALIIVCRESIRPTQFSAPDIQVKKKDVSIVCTLKRLKL